MTGARERLARYAHEAWSGWMVYLFQQSRGEPDGTVTIPAALVERWRRQMDTPYEMLPATEQASDRAEADAMLALVALAAPSPETGTRLEIPSAPSTLDEFAAGVAEIERRRRMLPDPGASPETGTAAVTTPGKRRIPPRFEASAVEEIVFEMPPLRTNSVPAGPAPEPVKPPATWKCPRCGSEKTWETSEHKLLCDGCGKDTGRTPAAATTPRQDCLNSCHLVLGEKDWCGVCRGTRP